MTAPTEARTDASARPADLVIAAWMILLTIALVASASQASIWYDELASLRFARSSFHDWLRTMYRGEVHGIVHHATLRTLVPLTGDDLLAIRAPAIIAWVAGVPLLYRLARRLAPPPAAAAAAIVYSLIPLGIEHAMEARMYSFAATATVGTTLALVRYVEAPSWRRSVTYGVAAAVGVGCHFMVLPVIAVQGFTLLIHPERRNLLRLAWPGAGLVALALVPLLVVTARDRGDHVSWVPDRTASETREILAQLVGLDQATSSPIEVVLMVPALLLLSVGLWSAVRPPSGPDRPDDRWMSRTVALWLTVPVIVVLAVSWLVTPMLVDRYLIVSLPAVVLVALMGARWLARTLPAGRTVIPLALVGLALLAAVPSVPSSWTDDHHGEDWRGAATFLDARLRPGDIVLVSDSTGGKLGADGLCHRRCEEGDEVSRALHPVEDLAEAADLPRPDRVWVVERVEGDESLAVELTTTLQRLGVDNRPVERWDVSALRLALHERPE